MTKNYLSILKYTGLTVLIGLITTTFFLSANAAEPKDIYTNLLKQWEVTHKITVEVEQKAIRNRCESEKTGAGIKLVLESLGALELTKAKRDELYQKRDDVNCDFKQPTVKAQAVDKKIVINDGVDYDKLARAIGWAETSGCTKGTGKSLNNCGGIRRNGAFVKYATKEDSYQDIAATWKKYYVRFPDLALAKKWTADGNEKQWLNAVVSAYNKQ